MGWLIGVIVLAFLWLLYETRLLTVRLPIGKELQITVEEVIPIIYATMLVCSIVKSFFGIKKPLTFWQRLRFGFKRWLNFGELKPAGGKG